MKNILWVINPKAGYGNHQDLIRQIKSFESDHIYLTTGENDDQMLNKLLDELNPDLVVSGGGDGTFKIVAGCLEHREVPVAILPLGSANGLAAELKLEQDASELTETYKQNNIKKISLDAIRINNDLCFHLADVGLNARIVKGFEKQSIRGYTGYALGALDQFGKEELYFNVEHEGKKHETLMVIIANARKYGTGVVVNPVGKINDGFFEIGILKQIHPVLVGQILFNPDESPSEEYFYLQSMKEVELHLDQKIDLQVDGEYIDTVDRINAKILPGFIDLVLPD